MLLQTETEEFRRVFERVSALHCPFGVHSVEIYLLGELIQSLERFTSVSVTYGRPFEHFNMLTNQAYRMTS